MSLLRAVYECCRVPSELLKPQRHPPPPTPAPQATTLVGCGGYQWTTWLLVLKSPVIWTQTLLSHLREAQHRSPPAGFSTLDSACCETGKAICIRAHGANPQEAEWGMQVGRGREGEGKVLFSNVWVCSRNAFDCSFYSVVVGANSWGGEAAYHMPVLTSHKTV